jgi:hypothetical protein
VGAVALWADINPVAQLKIQVPEAKRVSAETRAAGRDLEVEAATRLAEVEEIAEVVGVRRSAVVVEAVAVIAAAADVGADEASHELLTRHSFTIGNEIRLAQAGDRDGYHAQSYRPRLSSKCPRQMGDGLGDPGIEHPDFDADRVRG